LTSSSLPVNVVFASMIFEMVAESTTLDELLLLLTLGPGVVVDEEILLLPRF
jgi:hypothetical protein